MEAYKKAAILAVKNLLMELLEKEDWCQAKRVGTALEMLIENRQLGRLMPSSPIFLNQETTPGH